MAKKTSIELYGEILNEIRSEDRKPVYFLCGEEEFFLDKLQEEIEKLIPEDQKDFNFDLLYGRDVTPEKVLSIIRSFPMMAEFRIVILRDFKELEGYGVNAEGYQGEVEDLIPYFKQPNPTTLFVCIDTKKPHGKSKVARALRKNEFVGFHEFEEVPDYRLPDWILSWAQNNHRKKLEPPAAQMLAQYVGNNLKLLASEIEKVCTFADSADVISEDEIKEIIGLYREYSVFDLKDAIIARNLEKSLFIAEQMLHHSKSAAGEIIRSVGFFYSMFSNIWQINYLSRKGQTKKEVQKQLGINSNWYFNRLWKEASTFHLSEMPRIFEALMDADRASKGFSTMDQPGIFFLLIKRIINK